jgi:serine/threonine protein kinase
MPDDPATPAPEPDSPQLPHLLAGEGQHRGSTWRLTPSGSAPTVPGEGARILERVGDFEILGKLGQGGMGAVYRARQRSLDRQVALKILPASLEADADFVNRFQREARVAASLSHANLVKVYASGQADGCHYIAMELIEGQTLGDLLKQTGPLPANEALRIIGDAARALEYGWQRAQLIHREIKPGNIFLSQSGDVKVGDLGLAKSLGGDTTGLTQTGTAMGTPHYISPEQARGDKDLDYRADIYSLGCTLYQMLTGRTPYEGKDPMSVMLQHVNSPPPAILKVLPHCPIPLARLVAKTLKKSKHERHASYGELIAQIEGVRALFAPAESALESIQLSAPEATLPQTPGAFATPVTAPLAPPAKTKAMLYGAIAAGVAALAVVAFLFWPKPEEKLTKAQLYAKEHAGDAPSATPEPGPPAKRATPTPTLEPGAIKLWDAPGKMQPAEGVSWEDGALRLDHMSRQSHTPVSRDLIFRAAVRMNPDSESASLSVRTSGERSGDYYAVTVNPRLAYIVLKPIHDGKAGEVLQKWPLSRIYGPDEWLRLEIRTRGDQITVLADGQPLGTVQDASVPGPGGVMLYAGAHGCFRDIVYVPLDEPWQDMLHDPAKLAINGGVERTPEGLRLTTRGGARLSSHVLQRDGAVRVRVTFSGVRPELRARMNNIGDSYLLVLSGDGKTVHLARLYKDSTQNKTLRAFPLRDPLQPGQDYELELRAVGSTLTVKYNGEVLGTVADETIAEGEWVVVSRDQKGPPTLIKSLEFLDLDAPGRAPAP